MIDRYAVIGNPVAHSKSPPIHAEFARLTGEDIEYGRLLAPLDGFREAVERFRAEGGRGLNVTVPFKEDAYRLATDQSERARAAEAVNTLRFDAECHLRRQHRRCRPGSRHSRQSRRRHRRTARFCCWGRAVPRAA